MGAGRPNAREAAFRRFSPCGRRHAGGFGKGSVFLEHAGDFLRIVRLRQSELEKETGLLGIERAAFNEAGLVVLLHVRADHAGARAGGEHHGDALLDGFGKRGLGLAVNGTIAGTGVHDALGTRGDGGVGKDAVVLACV